MLNLEASRAGLGACVTAELGSCLLLAGALLSGAEWAVLLPFPTTAASPGWAVPVPIPREVPWGCPALGGAVGWALVSGPALTA